MDRKEIILGMSELKEGSDFVGGAIKERGLHPIFGAIVLNVDVKEERVQLIGGSEEGILYREIDLIATNGNKEEGLSLAIPYRLFKTALMALAKHKQQIELSWIDAQVGEEESQETATILKIGAGKQTFTINCPDARDYPDLKNFQPSKKAPQLVIDSQKFLDSLRQIRYAISKDETKQVLSGAKINLATVIKIEENEKEESNQEESIQYSAIATDGHRMAVYFDQGIEQGFKDREDQQTEQKETIKNSHSIILRENLVGHLLKICAKNPTVILTIDQEKGLLFAQSDNQSGSLRTISGVYPDVVKVLPPRNNDDYFLICDREELCSRLKALSTYAQKTIDLLPQDEQEIMFSTGEISIAQADFLIQNFGTAPCQNFPKLRFSFNYFFDVINNLTGNIAILRYTSNIKGVFLYNAEVKLDDSQPIDPLPLIADSKILHLIMPMAFQD